MLAAISGFHDGRGQPEKIERGKSERDRVRKSEGGNDFYQFQKTPHPQNQRGNEKKVIVSREDMEEPVTKIITKHLQAIQPRLRIRWAGRVLAGKDERLPAGEKEPFAESMSFLLDLNVTGFPAVPRREFEFVEHVFFKSKFQDRLFQIGNQIRKRNCDFPAPELGVAAANCSSSGAGRQRKFAHVSADRGRGFPPPRPAKLTRARVSLVGSTNENFLQRNGSADGELAG